MTSFVVVAHVGMKAQSTITPRRTGSKTMPDPRSSRMAWIGAWSGLFGAAIYNLAQSDGMLPINRVLFGIDTTLMMIWILVLFYDGSGGRS